MQNEVLPEEIIEGADTMSRAFKNNLLDETVAISDNLAALQARIAMVNMECTSALSSTKKTYEQLKITDTLLDMKMKNIENQIINRINQQQNKQQKLWKQKMPTIAEE